MKATDTNQKIYASLLNTIHRLRLIRNTTGELSTHTQIDLNNNNFSKKSDFITRCIYREFAHEVMERTGIDLDELITEYQAASKSFEKVNKTRKARPEFHYNVLRCMLDEKFAASKEAEPYRDMAEQTSDLRLAIYTLLILNILPSFQSKGGDVDRNSHIEHLSKLRDYFLPLYENSLLFKFAPYLTELYKSDREKLGEKEEPYTRLELILFTLNIIINLKNNCLPLHLFNANRYYEQCKIHPYLEQCVWAEYDCYGKNPVYWVFETLDNDYILSRREFDRAANQITDVRYELILYRIGEDITFTMLRQSEVDYICRGEAIPEHAYMNGVCKIDDLQNPQSIEWIFQTNRYDKFPEKMVRTEAPIMEQAIKEGWKVISKTGDYEYLGGERAVTLNYVYIEHESRYTESGSQEVVSWYKIPREGLLLEDDLMRMIVSRIRHDNRTYICFIPLNCSFDVTDSDTCAAAGIEIVNRIEVIKYTE